ncbi:MAG: hypothetical protein GY722_04140 [bacterium]|nr:hypothetical protein [bacterium]
MQDIVGAAKSMSGTSTGLPVTMTIDYVFENLSTATVFNLLAADDLVAVFGVPGVDWSFTSITSVPASFANPSFDGDTDPQLIDQAPAQSLLAGSLATITVEIEVLTFDNLDPDDNFCNGIQVVGEDVGGDHFADNSTDGLDPDPDGDDSPDERALSCVNLSDLPVTLQGFTIDD